MKLISGKAILITAISLVTGLSFVDIFVNGAPTTGNVDGDGHISETDGKDELSLTSPPAKKDIDNDVTPAQKVDDNVTPEEDHVNPSTENSHVEVTEYESKSDETETTTEKQSPFTKQDSDDEVGSTSSPVSVGDDGVAGHKTRPTEQPSTRPSPTSPEKPSTDETSSDESPSNSSEDYSPRGVSSQPASSRMPSSAAHLFPQRESQRYPSAYLAPPIPGSPFGDPFSSLSTSLMALTQPAELAKIITNPVAHVGDFINKGLDFLKQLIEPARALSAFQVRKVSSPPQMTTLSHPQTTTWSSLHTTTGPSPPSTASTSPRVTRDPSPQMTDLPSASQTGRRYYSI